MSDLRSLIAGLVLTLLALGFSPVGRTQQGSCFLDSAKSGDFVMIQGESFPGGHDPFIRPTDCELSPANRVIIVWGDDTRTLKVEEQLGLVKDESFDRFRRLLVAEFPLPPNALGTGARRFSVTAKLGGRLDISPTVGLIRDPNSNEVMGFSGYGHPLSFTKYRLVVRSVSDVRATELEPAANPPVENDK